MLYPVQELGVRRLQQIKDATKLKLLEKATGKWKKSISDFVIREVIEGDSTVVDVYDLEPLTAVNAAIPEWAFDAGDLTADDLSSILAATEQINDGAYVGFYGFYDNAGEGAELTGAATTPVAHGAITAVEFIRGSSTLDFWKTGHLYGYDAVMGISDRPVIFSENEKIDLKVCSTEDSEDKFAGFRGYICEPVGEAISPALKYDLRSMYGVSALSQLPLERQKEVAIRAGIDPVQELSVEQIQRLYTRVQNTLYRMIVDEGIAKNVAEARELYYIREFVAGDSSHATDFVDIDQHTPVTAGEQSWTQDATPLATAGTLNNVITTGQKIADKKFAAILGFADTTPNSKLVEIAPADASGLIDLWHVQHCYAYHDAVRGYTMRPTYYKQNSPFVLRMSVRVAHDHMVKPIMLIAEEYGNVVSKT